ncbi:MAG TPA: nickel ABC transporter permease [Thermomicrobiales bacterium]
MSRFLLGRLAATIPVLLGVWFLVFMMLHLVPGDPVKIMLADFQTSPEQVVLLRSQLHLDDPLPKQFARFVANAARGDLGLSIRSKRPVRTEIAENLGSTLQLAVAALLIAIVVGVILGMIAAIHQNGWLDFGPMLLALCGVSMPSFWLGLLLIFFFSLRLGWFPATGAGDLKHLVLPALTLGLSASAIIARLTRSSMLEVLRQEYMTTARAKGLRETRVLIRHGFKNALIPVVTIFGLQFGSLMAGTVIVETVFARPGIGRLIVTAILAKDFPMVQGIVLLIATTYVIVNLLVDISYGILDPRIRVGG